MQDALAAQQPASGARGTTQAAGHAAAPGVVQERRECVPTRAAIEADPVFSSWVSFGTISKAKPE